jgi:translation initiation factor IF-1
LFGRFVFIDAGRINAYVDQSALLSMLPRETLEVNTRDSAENLVHALGQEQNLKTSIVAHDKVVIHSHDAASALERIKTRETLGAQMESVLIRKTSLSDALWQILSQTSNETAIDDRAGVTR